MPDALSFIVTSTAEPPGARQGMNIDCEPIYTGSVTVRRTSLPTRASPPPSALVVMCVAVDRLKSDKNEFYAAV